MTKSEFTDRLTDCGWLWNEEDDKIHVVLKNKKVVEIDLKKGKLTEELIKCLGGHDVVHMTRIVGYYSKVHNWNDSKVGELKDRQRGRYQVSG